MPPIARGQTGLCQPLPVSNVPNTGRSLTVYRGLDEDCAVKIVRRRKYGKIEREREREIEIEEEEETLFDPKSTNVQITIPHISDIQFKQLCTHIYRHYVHKHSS